MKKLLVCALTSMSLLFASIANAEFVIGVQGGWAQVAIDDDVFEDSGFGCDGSACDGGSGFGFGLYGQFLTKTASGGAAGIHLGYASYPLETEVTVPNSSDIDIEYDTNVFDVLGVYRWPNNFFLMAGFSKYENDDKVTVNNTEYKLDGNDDTGFKLVTGFDLVQGSVVVSPAISYADYGDVSNTELRIGVGYRF